MSKAIKDALNEIIRAQDELERPDEEVEVTAGRLIDLSVFFAALSVVGELNDGAIDNDGKRLAIKYLKEFTANVDKFLAPMMEQTGFKAFKRGPNGWNRLSKESLRNDAAMIQRGQFIIKLLNKMQSRPVSMLDTFGQGLPFRAAKKLGDLKDAETPQEKLEKLAYIRLAGANTRTRLYVKQAIQQYGIEVPAFDEVVEDLGTAKELGSQIRAVEAQLPNASSEEELEQMKDTSSALREQVEELASESPSPQAVIAAAATEAAKAAENFATETGKAQGLSPDQESAMMARGKAVIAAGAGSGKTRVLAAKVAYHVNELGVHPSGIIATSFSKKSADEIVERAKRASGRGDELFAEPNSNDGFGTTHSISLKICRNHLPGGRDFEIYSKDTLLIKKAMKQVGMSSDVIRLPEPVGFFSSPTDALPPPEYPPYENPVLEIAEEVLPAEEAQEIPVPPGNDFQSALREALRWWEDDSNTSDLVNRWPIKWGYRSSVTKFLGDLISKGKEPEELSDAQRGWLFGNPKKKGAGIFPAAGVPYDFDSGVGVEGSVISGNYWKNPAGQWFNLGVGDKAWSNPEYFPRPVGPRQIERYIGSRKGNLITPSQDIDRLKESGTYAERMFAAAYAAYEWLKENDEEFAGKLTFDDMLIKASGIFISNPDILASFQSKYKVILVDEAQDLNPAQHLFFGLIAGYRDPATQQPYVDEAGAPTGQMNADTFAFIGDDKQAIYAFRGATPDEFIDLTNAGFATKMLKTNYRSGGVIVDSANRLISHNEKQIPMVCEAHERKRNEGIVEYESVEDIYAGAMSAASTIREMVDSGAYSYKDFGVGCRTNAEIYPFIAEMLKNQIPFKTPPGKFNLFSNPLSKAIIAWMRFVNSDDTKEMNQLIGELHRSPNFNLNKVFNEELSRRARGESYLDYLNNGGWETIYGQQWRNRNVKTYLDALNEARGMRGNSVQEILHTVLYEIKGSSNQEGEWVPVSLVDNAIYDARRDPEIIDQLVEESTVAGPLEEQIAAITDEQIQSLALAKAEPIIGMFKGYEDLSLAISYLDELMGRNSNLAKDDDRRFSLDAVAVDTLHGWKGLECKRMFTPMTEGVFPHRLSMGSELADERRLGYVAITRAQEQFTAICCEKNMTGEDAGPSMFIDEACIPRAGGVVEDDGFTSTELDASMLSAMFSDEEILEIMRQYEADHESYFDFEEGLSEAKALAELIISSMRNRKNK